MRSARQSWTRLVLPGGYSKSVGPSSTNPARRHTAFEAGLSTDG